MNYLLTLLGRHFTAQTKKRLSSRMAHKWGYASAELPPEQWHKDYPIAAGNNQSPIDLVSSNVTQKSFAQFVVDYHASDVKSVVNNGHSVTFSASGGKSGLCGGPLSNKYTLEQFHFHWGCDSGQGSEHLLDGKAFEAELHLVHWNSEKYSSFSESLGHSDGLCVLGVFLKAGPNENPAYQKMLDCVAKVPLNGNKHDIAEGLDAKCLLPGDVGSFFHYSGSLTTPPLSECVQWVVFKNPVELSECQLKVFRSLHTGNTKTSACLCDNFRPVQKIGTRTLYSS